MRSGRLVLLKLAGLGKPIFHFTYAQLDTNIKAGNDVSIGNFHWASDEACSEVLVLFLKCLLISVSPLSFPIHESSS